MNEKKVRVRFPPSPTGGLHLGGVRTALYNYLFARQHHGDFILRIEDTDQARFVPGAEEYIFSCLQWAGLDPDESSVAGGDYGPYRQSERTNLYRNYADQLVTEGHAYYAFDTPEELEAMRQQLKTDENPSPQYNHETRMKMRNSLTLSGDEVHELMHSNTPYVVRIKMKEEEETLSFHDMIRGEVVFNSSLIDDKVLLKADGTPTYHLAVVVDDHEMEISHVFRGEEWLPSAPVHLLLWKYLFGLDKMPQWAHFPLILGPNGKLSKRDGAQYDFPVFAMNWTDPSTGERTEGFREKGFLPEAFINFLAVLGWNDGSTQEVFSVEELIEKFSIQRVHSAGAHFDYEKAKWFNHEWIKRLDPETLTQRVKPFLTSKELEIKDDALLTKIVTLVRDRCTLLTDFYEQVHYFFRTPETIDLPTIHPKWNETKALFFSELLSRYESVPTWSAAELEKIFKELGAAHQLKPGDIMLPLRVMLVGGKYGPAVFDIAELLGKEETISRIKYTLSKLE